jgi:hypothetical protein
MTAIENHQIKGMTIRLFFSILISTATICSTVMYVYYDFKSSVQTALHESGQALQETAALRHSDSVQNTDIYQLQTNQRMLMFQMDQLYPKSQTH